MTLNSISEQEAENIIAKAEAKEQQSNQLIEVKLVFVNKIFF